MNEITSSIPRGIVISDDNIPFTAYQAIYHKLTKRVEIIARFISEICEVHIHDIVNLDARLRQLLAQYQVKGCSVQCIVSIKDGYTNVYSSIEKFKKA